MDEIVTCLYCDKDYWDFNIYRMLDGSLMCIDCVRDDVPVAGSKVMA